MPKYDPAETGAGTSRRQEAERLRNTNGARRRRAEAEELAGSLRPRQRAGYDNTEEVIYPFLAQVPGVGNSGRAHPGSGRSLPLPVDGDLARAQYELLLERGRADPSLYSNPNFLRELTDAERRKAEGVSVGEEIARSYSPKRSWRHLAGNAAKSMQDAVNGLGILAKEANAAQLANSAMDQSFWGTITGDEAF